MPAVRGFRLTVVSPTDLRVQKLEVKRGAYGLGAFAVNKISENQFIGGIVFPITLHPYGRRFVYVRLRVHR